MPQKSSETFLSNIVPDNVRSWARNFTCYEFHWSNRKSFFPPTQTQYRARGIQHPNSRLPVSQISIPNRRVSSCLGSSRQPGSPGCRRLDMFHLYRARKLRHSTRGHPSIGTLTRAGPRTYPHFIFYPFEQVVNLHFLPESGLSKLRPLGYHIHRRSRRVVLPEMVVLLARKLQAHLIWIGI